MHDHAHGSRAAGGGASAGSKYRRHLLIAFGVIGAVFVVELVGGILSGSLALLSDAAHMFTDVLGIGMALAGIQLANRRARNPQHTFGAYRAEVLAAGANALLLFGVGLYILYEAYQRLQSPPEVMSGLMFWIALAGLAANLFVFFLLREGAKESLNVEGAFLEVLADTLGSLGVIAAALIIRFTGWTLVDPLIAAAIGLFVVPRAARLGGQALSMLMQHAPSAIDVERVRARLLSIEGVDDLHDLHVWTLTSSMQVMSVHLLVAPGSMSAQVLESAQRLLRDEFSITHATIQVETSEGACGETHW